jgi:uncharacterized repeat protein (TIGR01451 family)
MEVFMGSHSRILGSLAWCVVVVALAPPTAHAQLPDCEVLPNSNIFKIDDPDPVTQGNNLTYTISIGVAFGSPPSCVIVSDPVPANTTFQSLVASGPGPGSWSCSTPPPGSGGTVTCTHPSMGPGTHTLALVVMVDPGFTGTLSNVATLHADTPAPCGPPPPVCIIPEMTTVVVPVDLIEFRVE